jgi:hypothetical protein
MIYESNYDPDSTIWNEYYRVNRAYRLISPNSGILAETMLLDHVLSYTPRATTTITLIGVINPYE